ncbi:MAG: hypothetical protein JNL42_14095 [Anaerolineae bacterium]|nr:hypothetical protein [Anaerolineae bacterium]
MRLTLHGLLFALAALLTAGLAVQFMTAPGYSLETRYGDSTVALRTSRILVFQVGDCIDVEWHVAGISAVYFNEAPAVGEQVERYCTVAGGEPTLSVTFPDGVTQEFAAPIRYWIEAPESWAGVFAAAALLVGGIVVALIGQPRRAAGDPGAGTRPAGRSARLLQGVGLLVVILILTAAVLEIVLRLAFSAFGTDEQKISYLYSRAEIDAASAASTLPLPGIDYSMSPFRAGNNDLGYRGDDVAVPKPEGVQRIVVLGASEVYGFTPPDQTFPAQLQRILRERLPESQIEVVNGGVIGYTSWQIFSSFALHALELEPDLAIFYLGRNDVERREIAPDCYWGANALLGLDPAARISTDLAFRELSPSVLYRFVSISLGLEPDPADFESRSTVIDVGCDRGEGLSSENIPLNPPVYFRRNIENAVAIARAQGVEVLLATWAYWEATEEPTDLWRDGIVEHNDIVRAIAEENGTAFLDYAPLAPQDRALWSDYYHPNGEGSRIQAEIFADAVLAAGLVR